VLSDAMFREHYHEHPYGAPILGPAENVARFDREMVMDFWRRWYTPDNMLVVGAGQFDAAEVAGEIRAAFEDAAPGEARRARRPEPRQQGLRAFALERHFERVRTELCWPASSFRDRDATHLDLLSYVLGECESSRLVQRVKESEGLADRIDSSAYTPLDPGVFCVNIETDAERAAEALRTSVREVERLREELVSREELERAQANFLASEHFERESVSALAGKLGSFEVLGGGWRTEAAYFEALRAATPEDLRDVARRYLQPEALTVGALLPEGGGATLDAGAIEREVAGGIEELGRIFAVPEHLSSPSSGTAVASAAASSRPSTGSGSSGSAIESYRLASGAQLHVLPRRELPIVAGRAAFLGGLLAEDAECAGITHFLTGMWTRGTQNRSASDFARSVESLAAEIDGFSGRSSLGLSFESASAQLDPTLDLFAEALLEPAFDPEEIERERRDTLAAIERREDQLAQQAFELFTRTHFEQHPYRLPLVGLKESVERFDSEKLRTHHERLIQAENLVIAVAGDVDPDSVASALSRRLAPLPTGAFAPPNPPWEAAPLERRAASLSKDRAQAHLVMGFRGLSVSDPDRYALEVITQLLTGQSGRLFLELRDRRSLAYSVTAMNVEGFAPGFFALYIATAPEKVEEARGGILEQLEMLISEPPPDDELAEARRNLIGNHAIDQQRNSNHAAHMALDALYGLGPETSQHYAEQIDRIDKEAVLRVARSVINLDAYTEALVQP
jgi:zinc protease